jgi:hypothetical protein
MAPRCARRAGVKTGQNKHLAIKWCLFFRSSHPPDAGRKPGAPLAPSDTASSQLVVSARLGAFSDPLRFAFLCSL